MPSATTFNTSGNREDLTDILTRIYPTETPLWSLAKKSTAKALLHEFQADNYSNPSFAVQPEAVDFAAYDNQSANRARFGARVQRFSATAAVSKEQEMVNTAGVASEFAEAKVKAMQQVLINFEAVACSDQDSSSAAGVTRTRGLGSWIQNGAQSDQAVPAAYRTPTAQVITSALSGFNEGIFKGVLESMVEQKGFRNSSIICLAGLKVASAIDSFPKSAVVSSTSLDTRRMNMDASSRELFEGIDIYNSPYGIVNVVRTNYNGRTDNSAVGTTQSRNRAYLFDKDLVEVAILKGMGFEEHQDNGGGKRGAVDMWAAVGVLSPNGAAKLALS